MKQVFVYLLIGPIFGFVTLLLMVAPLSPSHPQIHASEYFLLFAFLASVPPMFAAAFADLALKTRKTLGATCAGALAAIVVMTLFHSEVGALQIVEFGIAGAIPAAVCSWLSSEKQNGTTA